jgi:uncharacterized protein YcfL
MKKYTGFLLIGILLMFGCRENSVNITPDNQQLALEGGTPLPNNRIIMERRDR